MGAELEDYLLNICFVCDEILGAVVRRCSVKKVFLKISQNLQGNSYSRVSFLFQAWELQLYLKRDSGTGVLL